MAVDYNYKEFVSPVMTYCTGGCREKSKPEPPPMGPDFSAGLKGPPDMGICNGTPLDYRFEVCCGGHVMSKIMGCF